MNQNTDTVSVSRELLTWLVDGTDFAKQRMPEPTLKAAFANASKEAMAILEAPPIEAESANQWQPIDTAPRDGTWILLEPLPPNHPLEIRPPAWVAK